MKSIRLLILFPLLSSLLFSQSQFTVTPEVTSSFLGLGRTLVIESPIHNTSDEPLTLLIARSQNDLPQGWLSAMCMGGICFPFDLDTLVTNGEPPFYMPPIEPGEVRDFTLDVFTTGAGAVHGTAYIQLEFTDIDNPGESITYDFVVSSLSHPPVAYAGEDQTVTEENLVYLDGSLSEDPDGDDLSYLWIPSVEDVVLDDPESDTPTFIAPCVDEITVYSCTLQVNDGVFSISDTVNITVESTVTNDIEYFANDYKLLPAFPNPFNPETTIAYELSIDSPVKIKIFNLIGEQVFHWETENQARGRHSIVWNAANDKSFPLSSGIYFCMVELGSMTFHQRLILAK